MHVSGREGKPKGVSCYSPKVNSIVLQNRRNYNAKKGAVLMKKIIKRALITIVLLVTMAGCLFTGESCFMYRSRLQEDLNNEKYIYFKTVNGTVLKKANDEVVSGASIGITKESTDKMDTLYTNENGRYSKYLEIGKYNIAPIVYLSENNKNVGYTTTPQSFTVLEDNQVIETIYLIRTDAAIK